ncbi:SDR family NAD(P)-dependent oxidoreductase [Paracidovorax anthurii]|uniref:NAD(P)-dependent dehydrogenase (Short-subunit alcohol dehydrogenase family) n=1 Tax=Paracidovorax anthurii TaxID=78229 RepID=A0A328ZKY3_9BURK|nr:SDR family oxidoreductase [Paracidovorax anthurii]RAR86529.1 NAD(P)-dependent dehydrogenase (short-subunit alcohol dehydrogenase family) [Paracidovorax anthurii]
MTVTAPSATVPSAPSIALVTGGSRGLGRDAALQIAGQGMDVILTYRSRADEAQAVVAAIEGLGRRAVALPLDVGRSGGFAAFADAVRAALAGHWQRERFDFLVNNAGMGVHAPFAETTEAQFDELVNVHFKGVFFLTQALLPLMNDGGRIVNVSSGLARFALPGYAAYAAMKGAVEVLTRYLAKELGPRGIAVNVVAPGAIETDFGGGAVRDNAQLNAFIASQTALGRVGRPDDIGGVVASLLLPASRWINAQRIEASGGMFL